MAEMETRRAAVSKRKATYASKLKRAIHILFFKRHAKPGVKGWELRKALGSDYPKVLKILDGYLKNLDLEVKTVLDEGVKTEKLSPEQMDRARFTVVLRGNLAPKEAKMVGWRIDDFAGLAITIAYITSKKGKASREEVEALLREKLPGWKVGLNLERYIRYGYLTQDENGQMYLDWRTRAEVDQKALIDMLLSAEVKT
jgi:hypothetical protein